MSKAPSPRFLPTRWLSWVAAALVVSGLAAASQAAASGWPQRTVDPNAILDLADGRLHIAEMPLASANEIAQSGRIRMLAVTNARHSPAAPDIPTVGQSGYLQCGAPGMFGPEAPAGLRERIAADMRGVLAEPAAVATPANIGMAAHGTAPAGFAAILDEQCAKRAAMAHDHGIKPVPVH